MNAEIKNALQDLIDTIEPKIKKIDGPDYYISQSNVQINPELLIVGINPAGDKKLSQSEKPDKKPDNLIYDKHQYLENPTWAISKLNKIFPDAQLLDLYREAAILNYFAINTRDANGLNAKEIKEISKDCESFSNNFIYNILKPKQIIILGATLAKSMKLIFDHVSDSVLRTDDDKNYLVVKLMINNIPHYIIHHPSMPAFNGTIDMIKKSEFFNKEFFG